MLNSIAEKNELFLNACYNYNVKKRISITALIVIIFAELVGLFGILHLKHIFDIQVVSYNELVNDVIEEKDDIYQIKALLYKYEYYMSAMIFGTEEFGSELKATVSQTELELRNQIIKHGLLMNKMQEGSDEAILFRSVNDDVLNYLNYNAVLLSMKKSNNVPELQDFITSRLVPLITRVNISIDKLSALSETQTELYKTILNENLQKSGVTSFLSLVLMIIAIVVSISITYKLLGELETDNNVLKFKTELHEQRINEIQNNTIIGIADLVESRSGETGQHVKRTSHLVGLILAQAKKHNLWPELLTEQYIDFVTRAAPMHDIGKIIISDTILNKPGKLTPEEFEIMKTHASAGAKIVYEILGGIENIKYVEIASDIAHFHHEKWNGKGYPEGKKEKEIPLCARIMAVADVFDALISERCYKKAMSYEDAFNLIQNESGEHFDPQIVELFMELKDEILAER